MCERPNEASVGRAFAFHFIRQSLGTCNVIGALLTRYFGYPLSHLKGDFHRKGVFNGFEWKPFLKANVSLLWPLSSFLPDKSNLANVFEDPQL